MKDERVRMDFALGFMECITFRDTRYVYSG